MDRTKAELTMAMSILSDLGYEAIEPRDLAEMSEEIGSTPLAVAFSAMADAHERGGA